MHPRWLVLEMRSGLVGRPVSGYVVMVNRRSSVQELVHTGVERRG